MKELIIICNRCKSREIAKEGRAEIIIEYPSGRRYRQIYDLCETCAQWFRTNMDKAVENGSI